jgi:hypothetical protein
VFASTATGQRSREFDFEMHQQRTGTVQQQVPCLFAFDGASAECQNGCLLLNEPRNGFAFSIPKRVFAVAREDFGDRDSCLGLNDMIDIDKAPAKTRCEERTNGRFAGAHEASKYDAPWHGKRASLICRRQNGLS